VGHDRLVNAYAGLKLHGPGLIIMISERPSLLMLFQEVRIFGRAYCSGISTDAGDVESKYGAVAYVELARPWRSFGRDTVSSIRAGLVFWGGESCDGVVDRLLKKECHGYTVIATGGDAA